MFADLPLDLQKIADAVIAEVNRLQEERAAQERLDQLATAILAYRPQSQRDAAACRATLFAPTPNGRPQFFIPNLGE